MQESRRKNESEGFELANSACIGPTTMIIRNFFRKGVFRFSYFFISEPVRFTKNGRFWVTKKKPDLADVLLNYSGKLEMLIKCKHIVGKLEFTPFRNTPRKKSNPYFWGGYTLHR